MTFTSEAQANSKTAEFARLFDLFNRVATRRTRALPGGGSEVISSDDIANVPAEFAPVLKNLSTVLSLRMRRGEEHAQCAPVVPTTKPCHNAYTSASSTTPTAENLTLGASATEPSGEPEEYTGIPTTPLGEHYPFTFKLMLHKLYDLDEWAEKVKDAVEASRSQFKPLAERVQSVVRDTTSSINEKEECSVRPNLGVSAKFKPPSTTRQSHGAVLSRDATTSNRDRGEKRNGARPALGVSAKFKPPTQGTARRPRSTALPSKPAEASRVAKKRCIGRRKSLNGPISTGVWVYDAAISATEVAGPHPAVQITLSTASGAGGAFENRARHRSLTALEDMQTRGNPRRKVKITVPLKTTESIPPRPSSVSREIVVKTETVVKRRGSVASVFASEPCKRAVVKRPLCI